MSDQRFIVTFDDVKSYKKYKEEVTASGGIILNDLGEILLGFTAVIPATLVNSIRSGNLVGSGSGITTFEPDSEVRIQG